MTRSGRRASNKRSPGRHVLPRASLQDQVTRQRFAAGSPPSRQSASFRWADQPPIPSRIGNFGGRPVRDASAEARSSATLLLATAPLARHAYELRAGEFLVTRRRLLKNT